MKPTLRRTVHQPLLAIVSWLIGVSPVAAIEDTAPPTPPDSSPPAQQDASPDDPPPQPSPDQIAQWIAELDSNRYETRERATQQLLAAGAAVLDALLLAANGDRPEPAHRAVWILRQMAESPDIELRRAALERLVQLKDRPQVVAQARRTLAEMEHKLAVQAITKLGGWYSEEGVDPNWGQPMPKRLVLDDDWRGGNQGLEHAAKLHDVSLVILVGTDVSRQGVAKLAQMESLQQLFLYGTPLTDEDVDQLRQELPGVEIDFRRGALLGVRGQAGVGNAIVQSVQPDTAAARAGLQRGDIIRRFNGQQVKSFEDLTDKIAQHRPGDKATLEIRRGGQTLEVDVTFGQWELKEPNR